MIYGSNSLPSRLAKAQALAAKIRNVVVEPSTFSLVFGFVFGIPRTLTGYEGDPILDVLDGFIRDSDIVFAQKECRNLDSLMLSNMMAVMSMDSRARVVLADATEAEILDLLAAQGTR